MFDTRSPRPLPTPPRRFSAGPELARWLVLLLTGTWLLHPYMTSRAIGAGDAIWYANMLGDFVTQWRAGIFPVFAGQTEMAFNGAAYPLRVAPLYQHLGGIVDVLTGRQLGFYALQHSLVILCGFVGLAVAYLAGARLVPQHRWVACGLAVLYLSCPGVLGAICTQDLYMTWTAVPLLPTAAYGIQRTFRKADRWSPVWLAAPLAALWHAHAPVALWMTMIAAATQVIQLLASPRCPTVWRRALLAAGLFAALGHYPFVSVAALSVPGVSSAATTELAEADRITQGVHDVFPAILQPLSSAARQLSDLQLGYGLWAVLLLVVAAASSRKGPPGGRTLAASCLALLVLLLPVPGITDWLWQHVPGLVKRITSYWPMQRFYLLIAALLSVAGAAAWASVTERWPRLRSGLTVGLALGCGWSLWEARQFGRAVAERTGSAEATAVGQRPENRLLARFSYNLFPRRPDYFSNGVMDASTETRLLDPATRRELPSPAPAPDLAWLRSTVDSNPGILNLAPALVLEPGRRFALTLEFSDPEIAGVLQLVGRTFFREYILPESGDPLAFGARPGNSHMLSLWTTSDTAETVTLRFIPTLPSGRPAATATFARYSFHEITPEHSLITMDSLLPFRAQTRAAGEAWLETPRMFQPGYVATVNGHPAPVVPSPQGLAMVAIPGGRNVVELRHRGPLSLRISYFSTLGAWFVLAMGVAVTVWASRHRPPAGSHDGGTPGIRETPITT